VTLPDTAENQAVYPLHEGEDSFTITVSDDVDGSTKQLVTICTYIDNSICDTLTKPDLVSPPHGAIDIATSSDFEWKQSKLKNKKRGDISWRVIVCKSSEFVGCTFINIPKDIVDKANNQQAAALGIGGTSVLFLGLMGGLSQRRYRKVRYVLITVAILLSACNSAVEEATPGPTPVNKSGNIVFSVPNLDSNTSYFWKVVSTDETTQKSAQSVTQKFITAP